MRKHINALKKTMKEFFEFSAVSVISFIMVYGITLFITELLHIQYNISYAFGLGLSYIYQFYFNMKITFVVKDRTMIRIERFVVVALLIIFLNWSIVYFSVELLNAQYWQAIPVVALVLWALNFELQEVWVFRKIPASKHHKVEKHINQKQTITALTERAYS